MNVASSVTEADILKDVIDPSRADFGVEAARSILGLGFSGTVQTRIRRLLQSNSRGVISAAERSELEKYLRVGQLVDLLQAKARVSLARANA